MASDSNSIDKKGWICQIGLHTTILNFLTNLECHIKLMCCVICCL